MSSYLLNYLNNVQSSREVSLVNVNKKVITMMGNGRKYDQLCGESEIYSTSAITFKTQTLLIQFKITLHII